jgi:hypothetical protein
MAFASVYTGFKQAGTTYLSDTGDPGRYGRTYWSEMIDAGVHKAVSSARIYAGQGAPTLILFKGNYPGSGGSWDWDIAGDTSQASFHGPFLQLTNGTSDAWDVELNVPATTSWFNDGAGSLLVVRTELASEQRLSVKSLVTPLWNSFFDQNMPGTVEQVGDPFISWHAFSAYSVESAALNPDRIYIQIKQKLNIVLDGWSDYEAWVKFWIRLRADGSGGVTGGVRMYEWWVEGGIFSGVVAAILDPNVALAAVQLENAIIAAVAGIDGGVTDVYYLPGSPAPLAGGGKVVIWGGDTRGDVTMVIQR